MTERVHVNNVSTFLNGAITYADTVVVVEDSTGFPALGAGQECRATLQDGELYEIVIITNTASDPSFTITRGAEGTTPLDWPDLSIFSIRTTADSHDRKQDRIAASGDAVDFGAAASFEIPNSAAPVVNAAGEMALDTTITDHKALIKYYTGAEEMVVIAVPTANLTVTDTYVLSYDAATDSFRFTASGSSFTRTTATGTTQAAAVNTAYTCTNAAQCNVTAPGTAAVNDIVEVQGQGAGGFKITANSGQTIVGYGDTTTTAGSVTPANRYDNITLVCIVANTTWAIKSSVSSLLTFA